MTIVYVNQGSSGDHKRGRLPRPPDWAGPLSPQLRALLGDAIRSDSHLLYRDIRHPLPEHILPSWKRDGLDKAVAFHETSCFDGKEFDTDALLDLKKASGRSVHVIVPAYRESETIGQVLSTHTTFDSACLIDTITVVVNGVAHEDDDETPSRVRAFQKHYEDKRYDEIKAGQLPRVRLLQLKSDGKGNAMRAGFARYIAKPDDIFVTSDADLKNVTPYTISGLLGPMLQNPGIEYSKGTYREPGGRLTLIGVIPLIEQYFPELMGFTSGSLLRGEYALTKSALDRLHFLANHFVVETQILTALLVANDFKLDRFAQVYLGTREHEIRPTWGHGVTAGQCQDFITELAALTGRTKLDLGQLVYRTVHNHDYKPVLVACGERERALHMDKSIPDREMRHGIRAWHSRLNETSVTDEFQSTPAQSSKA